jgi:hypothetical protein
MIDLQFSYDRGDAETRETRGERYQSHIYLRLQFLTTPDNINLAIKFESLC